MKIGYKKSINNYKKTIIDFYVNNIVYIWNDSFTTIYCIKRIKKWNMKINNVMGKELILSLIKDDLINVRLVHGLEKLGLASGEYYLHLSETIFKLVGITVDDEDFFEDYMDECKTVNNIDIFKHPELLNSLTLSLYNKLVEEYKSKYT